MFASVGWVNNLEGHASTHLPTMQSSHSTNPRRSWLKIFLVTSWPVFQPFHLLTRLSFQPAGFVDQSNTPANSCLTNSSKILSPYHLLTGMLIHASVLYLHRPTAGIQGLDVCTTVLSRILSYVRLSDCLHPAMRMKKTDILVSKYV